ncbi:hypothetical protein [Phytomonospora endophytica]|uniref:Uncharacterized protein n=1 Tax=Phytomonospora endophytica TaxID=714109 RepID=A0A841F7B9_9ACTN|nr:hypothetical protein [Phytomonospora endophytica]MBB6032911.1 hypothetical protein [Phytomonospora endophytica]GIG65137.1 hypothetical protein Pen01_14320 [Phytomonospora endophytica]
MTSPQPPAPAPKVENPPPDEAESPKRQPKTDEPPAKDEPRSPDEEGKSGGTDKNNGEPEKSEPRRNAEDARAPGPDERSIPENLIEALLNATGYRADRINSHGPMAYGEGATANQYFGVERPDFRLEPRTEESVREELDAYVAGPSDELLNERLRDQHLVCLLGEPRSGRTHAALSALAQRHGAGGLADLIGPADAPLAAATREADLLRHGCGHLLRLEASKLSRRELTDLESIARTHNARVVVIADQTGQHGELARFVVDHMSPDPAEVFQAHLRRLLVRDGKCAPRCSCATVECPAFCVEAYGVWCLDDQGLRAELSAIRNPQEATMLASAVATRRIADDIGLREVTAGLSTRRVDTARSLLAATSETDPVKRRWLRAFRIAYTVLSDCPRVAVMEAASDLFQKMRPVETTAVTTNPVLPGQAAETSPEQLPDITFDKLIPPDMRDRHDGDDENRTPSTNRIMPALLDVAWNDYPSSPRILTSWLDELVLDRSPKVRSRAAVVAGYFSGFDRELIFSELISGWARHDRGGVRQAAALTCVFAMEDKHPKQIVTDHVRRWSRNTSSLVLDTVARAYAAGLSERVSMRKALQDLRRIASKDWYWYSPMVGLAMRRLLSKETAPVLVGQLLDWLHDGLAVTTVHAARTMVELAEHNTQTSLTPWPTVLRWSGGDREDLNHIAELWCNALLLPPSAFAAWRALEGWVHAAGFDPALEEIVLAVVGRLCAVAPLRVRMRFHLERVWSQREPRYPTAVKVAEILKEADR